MQRPWDRNIKGEVVREANTCDGNTSARAHVYARARVRVHADVL